MGSKENIFVVNNKEALKAAALWLIQKSDGRKKWFLYGVMGAGKTTLVKYLVDALGFNNAVSSPTFSIVNVYEKITDKTKRIYHIDLYRLKNYEEALDIDIESYLDDAAFCFIEWPQIIENLADTNFFKIFIETTENSERKIIIL